MKYTAAQLWLTSISRKTGEDATKNLVELALLYAKNTEGEMGAYRLWREQATYCMENDFEWRVTAEDDNIFRLSNETMGVVRSGIGFLVARIQDDIFGASPWFALAPEGGQDVILTGKIFAHAAWKLRQCKYEAMGNEVVERVLNFGEAIQRVGWKRDVQTYGRIATVLMDAEGDPVLTMDGDYVYAEDELSAPEQAEGAEPGPQVVAKDPTITITEGMHFAELLIEETEVRYNGLDPKLIDWRNFLCSPTYACIEDAPFRGHKYEMRFSQLKAKLREYHGTEEKEWPQECRDMMERLRNETTSAKDATRTDRRTDGAAMGADEKDPVIECLDFEMEWDPEGEGNPRLLFGTVLCESEQLFFVEYLCNILPETRSLYTVTSAYNLPNTWHGRGWWELFQDVTMNIDRVWNTLLHRDGMISNPITGYQEGAFKEDIANMKLKPGVRLAMNAGKRLNEALEAWVMPNVDASSWEILQWFLKVHQLETGVTSSAQGSLGDMPATNTATGIQSVLASGSTLHKRPAHLIRDGLGQGLWKLLTLLYANHDSEETFQYGEGQNQEVAQLGRADIAGLKFNIHLTMTRFRQREVIERSTQALDVVTRYLSFPEAEKGAVRETCVELLKSLDIPNADAAIRQPLPPVDTSDEPPVERIGMNFPDLPPSAKAVVLQSHGLPADLEEIKAMDKPPEKKAPDLLGGKGGT